MNTIENMETVIGKVIWLFGRPCAGKTTLANSIETELKKNGTKTIAFDGDDLRKGLNSDLGYTITDRRENIRRAAELANLCALKGYHVVCSFVTPTEEMRNLVKSIITVPPTYLVFVDADIETCMARDVKGHYQQAKEGKLDNFTGIASPFEEPREIDCRVNTGKASLNEATETCLKLINS